MPRALANLSENQLANLTEAQLALMLLDPTGDGGRIIDAAGKRSITPTAGDQRLADAENQSCECKCADACYMRPKDCVTDFEWPGIVITCKHGILPPEKWVFRIAGRCMYVDSTFPTLTAIPAGSVLIAAERFSTTCAACISTPFFRTCDCQHCLTPGDTVYFNFGFWEFGDGDPGGDPNCDCVHDHQTGYIQGVWNGTEFEYSTNIPHLPGPGHDPLITFPTGPLTDLDGNESCTAEAQLSILCQGVFEVEPRIFFTASPVSGTCPDTYVHVTGDCLGVTWISSPVGVCMFLAPPCTVVAGTALYFYQRCWDGFACVDGSPDGDGNCP